MCSSRPSQTLLVAVVHRSIHIYNYQNGKLLLQKQVGSFQSTQGYSKLFFLDNDSIIGIQDGKHRIQLLSVNQQSSEFA